MTLNRKSLRALSHLSLVIGITMIGVAYFADPQEADWCPDPTAQAWSHSVIGNLLRSASYRQ